MYYWVPSFEILANIFTHLSVFDSRKGSSNTLKTCKNISLYFIRRHLIICNYNIPRACLLNRPPVPAMDLKSNRSGL